MIVLTRAQRVALFKVFQRDFPGWISPVRRHDGKPCPNCNYIDDIKVPSTQWRKYRKAVRPSFDKSGAVMLHWSGMWLGIERDGYTHT